MYTLEVSGRFFEDSPIWWQNFSNYCSNLDPSTDRSKITTEILKNEYQATKIYGTSDLEELSFSDETLMSLFLLRWS
jgi:hypothetical protein